MGLGEIKNVILSIGTHNITLVVTDTISFQDNDSISVTIQDTTLPEIFCLDDITHECEGPDGAYITLAATATDICDDYPEITNSYNSHGADASDTYPIGITTVVFTARDDSGNESSCSVMVEIVDTTPPEIFCPADITHECEGPDGAYVTLVATATDICDDYPEITNSYNSHGADASDIYPIGITIVVFTARDDSGNESSCTVTVEIVDTTPPEIFCPDDVSHECVGTDGAYITLVATATKICDDDPEITNTFTGYG